LIQVHLEPENMMFKAVFAAILQRYSEEDCWKRFRTRRDDLRKLWIIW
jgi:hypothetical protein